MTEINFSKFSIIKHKFCLTMEKIPNYSHKEIALQNCQVKRQSKYIKVRIQGKIGVVQAVN